VLTAVGPVHLERFGSLEAIATAKAEIFDGAQAVVVNADNALVTRVMDTHQQANPAVRVIRCSTTDAGADVHVRADDLAVSVRGQAVGRAPAGVFPMNVACAVGAALALGVPTDAVAARLGRLTGAAHRQEVARSEGGVAVIDDTYNANPAGAAAAVRRLAALADGGARRIVVTPGMVELGHLQRDENEKFAATATQVATDLVVVGATNRRALVAGSKNGKANVTLVPTLAAGVEWVRANAGPGDAVLYENDLPDHYP
jgi:UDP-N-acetylmuramoyl-tripeptide--D-alanyl-D-alanine ligase